MQQEQNNAEGNWVQDARARLHEMYGDAQDVNCL